MLNEKEKDECLAILTKQVPNVQAAKDAIKPDVEVPESVRPDKLGIDAPLVIPEGERNAYIKMHSLRKTFALQLQSRWNRFKKEYGATLDKTLNTEQKNVFEGMLNDFSDIALKAFQQGVDSGNSYFEQQFKVQGLNDKQQAQLVNKHLGVFEAKSYNLFYKEAASALDGVPADKQQHVLDGFDRFLLNYANVAVSIAYDTFTRGISLLNRSVGAAFKIGGLGLPTDPVKVIWVLAEDASHSIDCEAMAMGMDGDGSGIWDARQLAEMGLMPGSSLLDCGGNCRCHLSAYVPLDASAAHWLDSMTEAAPVRNALKVQSNITANGIRKLLVSEGVTLNVENEEIFSSILANPLLRRSELWRDLDSFSLQVVEGDTFAADGLTVVRNRGSLGKLPDTIELKVTLPKGTAFADLTQFEKDEIVRVAAHEFGHTIAFPLKATVTSNILDREAATQLVDTAGRSLDAAVARISANFDNAVRAMAKSTITAQMKQDISVMKTFLADPQNLIESIFYAVQNNEQFGSVSAREAWRMVEAAIAQYSPGTRLLTAYQLRSSNEYLAEWLSVLLTNPERAAILDPDLNRAVSKLLPSFFDSAAVRRASTLLPDSLALAFRLDVPAPGGLTPVAPNVIEFGTLTDSFVSKSKRFSDEIIQKDVLSVLESNPLLQRSEFFKNLEVGFVDRVQMGKMSGSRNNIGFFDKGTFTVNYDYWKTLTTSQKQATLSDVIGEQLWRDAKPLLKTEIKDAYSKDYLGRTLEYLQNKAGVQRIGTRMVAEVKAIALGVGEKKGDLSFWTRNYEQYFLPVIKNVPDLPLMNLDSLASPKDFWMSWFRLYVTQPSYAAYYSRDLFEILGAQLRLGILAKWLFGTSTFLEKAGLGSLVGRIAQLFGNKSGFWITTRTGSAVFIEAEREFGSAAEAATQVNKLGSLFTREPSMNSYVTKLFETDSFKASPFAGQRGVLGTKVGAMVDGWSDSASDHDLNAWLFQMASADTFGLKKEAWLEHMVAQSPKFQPAGHAGQYYMYLPHLGADSPGQSHLAFFETKNDLKEFALNSYVKEGSLYRAVVSGMHEMTQEGLAKANVKSVSAFRGMGWAPESTPGWVQKLPNDGTPKVLNVNSNPISSWTLSEDIARSFGVSHGAEIGGYSVSLSTKIPAEDILSFPNTGFGVPDEQEIVVIARPRIALARRSFED